MLVDVSDSLVFPYRSFCVKYVASFCNQFCEFQMCCAFKKSIVSMSDLCCHLEFGVFLCQLGDAMLKLVCLL